MSTLFRTGHFSLFTHYILLLICDWKMYQQLQTSVIDSIAAPMSHPSSPTGLDKLGPHTAKAETPVHIQAVHRP